MRLQLLNNGRVTASNDTLPGWTRIYSGKVRDLYTSLRHPDRMLMVASDRVSAFDHLLEPGIPGKGELLTTLSLWWFDQLDGIPNHLLAGDSGAAIPDAVAGRTMLVKALDMYPIECVVRGYLAGSAWAEYQKSRSICGVALADGLAAHWDKTGTPPVLPPEIVTQTAARYRELIERLTGSAVSPSAASDVTVPVDPAAATGCEGCE